jgi:hypothetical protein
MRTRLRLGAATVVALGALLLATALASPAFAWHSVVDVEADCLEDGSVAVSWSVAPFEEGHDATANVFYVLDGEKTVLAEDEELGDGLADEFELPAGTMGTLKVFAFVHWKSGEKSKNFDKVELPKCEHDTTTSSSIEDTTTSSSIEDTTTSSSIEDTTSTSEQEETTTSSGEEETTTSEVLGETSTTAGGQLPFTGASSGPMLLAGIGLVAGGLLFLWSSRTRNASR